LSAARISKKQMKEDTFISATIRAWEYVRAHEKQFFIGLVAIVCAAAVVGWATYAKKQTRTRASSQFADALASYRTGDFKTAQELFGRIAKDYGSVQEGLFSDYFVGKCALESGNYLDAIKAFDGYLEHSGQNPLFHDAAMEGKAVALENEHRYEDAANTYLELAKNIKTNIFMEPTYLHRAVENFRSSNQTQRAIEVLGMLLDKTKGTERRDVEIELQILRG
jgi:tetratricopeptide (TPR) repeat protein